MHETSMEEVGSLEYMGRPIRVFKDGNDPLGEPYFCMHDIGELTNVSMQQYVHVVDAGDYRFGASRTKGKLGLLSARGVNLIMIRPRNPEAGAFRHWFVQEGLKAMVTSLPQIERLNVIKGAVSVLENINRAGISADEKEQLRQLTFKEIEQSGVTKAELRLLQGGNKALGGQ